MLDILVLFKLFIYLLFINYYLLIIYLFCTSLTHFLETVVKKTVRHLNVFLQGQVNKRRVISRYYV